MIKYPLIRIFTVLSILLGILSSLYFVFAEGIEDRYRLLDGIGGVAHVWGVFRSANGNAGTLVFSEAPTGGGYTGAHVYSHYDSGTITNTLTGHFWMETIGWVGGEDLSGVTLIPDPSGNPRGDWLLSGSLWSESAGWVDMSGITFIPDTGAFSGFAWNDGVGWIDIAGMMLAGTSSGLIGKVKVLGNIGGSRIFNTVYDLNQRYSSVKTTQVINAIQKNMTLFTRNAHTGAINPLNDPQIDSFRDTIIYMNTGVTLGLIRYSDLTFQDISYQNVRSMIIIGANVYIDESVIPPAGDKRPRAIIAIPNERGVGGNIYIAGNVGRIESSLIAGGSIFSGYFPPTDDTNVTYYNDNVASTIGLPNRQLYIYGTVISHNTIGGSAPNDGISYVCPFLEVNCNRDVAIRYDWNYFRSFDGDELKRAYTNPQFDNFAIVIEYNQGILRDPPPGLSD